MNTSQTIQNGLKILTLTAILGTLSACSPEPNQAVEPSSDTIAAQTLTVMPRKISETYTANGSISTDKRVEIASRIMGYIRDIKVSEGDVVKKGQVLLHIDPTEIQASLSEAQARVSQAKARLKEADNDLARYLALFEKGLIALSRYQKAELSQQLATEELRVTQAGFERIRVQLQYADILSPVDGIVVAKHRQTGDIANPGAAILTIEDPNNIVLRAFVKESHIHHIHVGDRTQVKIDALKATINGTVITKLPSGDANTHSYLIKIVLDSTLGLRTGMFGRAQFNIGSQQGIAIPINSIKHNADIPGVYKVDDKGIAHYRMIRTGRTLGGMIEVIAGISAGDTIVTSDLNTLHSGDTIVPKQSGSE